MSKLEQVSKRMMAELNDIRKHELEYRTMPSQFLNNVLEDKYVEISKWYWRQMSRAEAQFKLIEHVFGDTPQFEAEKPKKWIVRAKDEDNDYWYLLEGVKGIRELDYVTLSDPNIVKFDTKEEAEKWATPQCEVVEVEE